MRRRRTFAVDPTVQRVVKLLPMLPPRRGEVVLVDGQRCQVTSVRVRWREPGVWTLVRLRVRILPGRVEPDRRATDVMGSGGWPVACTVAAYEKAGGHL